MNLLLALLASSPGDAPAISPVSFLEHVRFLASDELEGRRSGTLAADRAARYVETRLRRFGLEPAGEEGGFFQPFEVPLESRAGEGSKVMVKFPGKPADMLGGKVAPLPVSAAGEASGEVLFAGYGITDPESGYDDYAGVEAKDKVVLVLRYGPGMKGGEDPHAAAPRGSAFRDKVLNAKHQGASALLLCNGWSPAAPADDAFVPFAGEAADLGLPALQISNDGAAALATGLDLHAVQARIDAERMPRSAILPGVRVAVEADVVRRRGPTRNVLGLLPGSDPSSGTVVVGAHYDHLGLGGEGSLEPAKVGEIHNGADDNASGTAALIEIARSLSARRERLVRSILFVAFSGEEEGLLGSAKFVESPPSSLGPIVAMLNLDMVGRSREGSLEIGGAGTSPRWKPAIEEGNAGLGLKVRTSESARGFGGSDHLSFFEKGIPVLFFFTGVHPDYHRASDDAEKVNAEDGARIAELAARIALAIASSGEPVPFVKPKEPEIRGGEGPIRAWLGTVPDYAESEGGVRLSGVSAGSPAEKAALQRGDLIKRIGSVKVSSIYDLTFALQQHKPGDVVELDFEREGESRTIRVTLAARGGGS